MYEGIVLWMASYPVDVVVMPNIRPHLMSVIKAMKPDCDSLALLHDGLLELVQVKNKAARLEFKTDNGEDWVIEAHGVVRARIDNFLEGNVVLDCEVIDDESEARPWLEWLRIGGSDAVVRMWSEEIAARRLSLLVLSPSYGATLAILASSFSMMCLSAAR